MSHQAHNRRAWDSLVRERQRHTKPARDNEFANPLAAINGDGWLGESIAGKHVLCLASGGGRQSALYVAAGAIVTVVDLSPGMLALDRQVAAERGFNIRAVESSMEDLSMFAAGEFDFVVQPVSTCYVPDIGRVYREVARVTAPGGCYISQHKQPASLQADVRPGARGYELVEPYYREGPLPEVIDSPHREPGTLEYLHRWEELLGGLCRAGFVIEDVMEPPHATAESSAGTFSHRSKYVAPYVRIKARRTGQSATGSGSASIWTP